MKIIIFAYLAGSPSHGMVYGHYYLAREWVRQGHEVTIVSASFAHTRFKQPLQSNSIEAEFIDGIRYIWLPTPAYNPASGFGRLRNMVSFSLQCFYRKLPVHHADLVICSSHQPFPVYAAKRYARKFNARLVFEVRDLWPLTLIELGKLSRNNPFIAVMQYAEDYAYKHADYVVSVLPDAKKYMIGRGMHPNKFIFIPNGVNLSNQHKNIDLPMPQKELMLHLKASGKFIIGYAGRVGLANALHILVEALALGDDNQVVVAILGYGAYVNELKSQAVSLKVDDRVYFLDPVGKDQVHDFLDMVDVAYIGLQMKPVFRFGVSPTKLNDFMLAKKPIIYAVEAPGDIVAESGSGISCSAENPKALSEAIIRMKNLSQEKRIEMGLKGFEWIKSNRDYKILALQFLLAVMNKQATDQRLKS